MLEQRKRCQIVAASLSLGCNVGMASGKRNKANSVQEAPCLHRTGCRIQHFVRSSVRMPSDKLNRHVLTYNGSCGIEYDGHQGIHTIHVGHDQNGIVVVLGKSNLEPLLMYHIFDSLHNSKMAMVQEVVQEAKG